jgi:DNA-binding GntR family transcriptional regulator
MAMFDARLLREQVYLYLRGKIASGELSPGTPIKLSTLSKELEVSTSPLRDALMQLDFEGFVEITPRKSIVVRKLTYEQIRDLYQVIGALEVSVLYEIYGMLTDDRIVQMQRLNEEMKKEITVGNYEKHYHLNRSFHETYISISKNKLLHSIVNPYKERLLDFRKRYYDIEWELIKCDEHQMVVDCLKKRNVNEAARVIREIHWNADAQIKYIKRYFLDEVESNL